MVLSAPQHKRVASKCFQARLFEIRCLESHAQMVGTLPSTPHQGKNTVVVTARGNKQQMCCRQTNTSSSPITVPTQNPTRGTQQDSKLCCADSGSRLSSIPTASPSMGSTHSPLPTPNPTTQPTTRNQYQLLPTTDATSSAQSVYSSTQKRTPTPSMSTSSPNEHPTALGCSSDNDCVRN